MESFGDAGIIGGAFMVAMAVVRLAELVIRSKLKRDDDGGIDGKHLEALDGLVKTVNTMGRNMDRQTDTIKGIQCAQRDANTVLTSLVEKIVSIEAKTDSVLRALERLWLEERGP